jgi:hypothetical protein
VKNVVSCEHFVLKEGVVDTGKCVRRHGRGALGAERKYRTPWSDPLKNL